MHSAEHFQKAINANESRSNPDPVLREMLAGLVALSHELETSFNLVSEKNQQILVAADLLLKR